MAETRLQQIARWSGIAFITAILLIGLSYIIDAVVLIFAGLLLSIFLRIPAGWLARTTHLPQKVSVMLVALALVAALALFGALAFPKIGAQVDALIHQAPAALHVLERELGRYGWGRNILAELQTTGSWLTHGEAIVGRATGWAATTVGFVFKMIVILFVGLYLSLEPETYRSGLLHLVSHEHRAEAAETIDAVHETLRAWLLTKLVSMASVGVMTGIGFWALGIPLAFTLSLFAGALTFIPNVGAILGLLPALLMGLTKSPASAFWVFVVYISAIAIESYVITPTLERRSVSLPPALTLALQAILGILVGGIGLAVATPLIAAGLVVVKLLYVRDVIGDPVDVPALRPERQRPSPKKPPRPPPLPPTQPSAPM
jgi:predicted PurR-regulated permease PerM